MAARAGLSDEQLDAVGVGPDADVWTERQRLLIEATDQLHAHRSLDAATRDAADAELTPKQVVELCFLVGHYEMLAMLLDTRGVEPDRPISAHRRSDLGHWSHAPAERTLEP